MMHWVNDIWGNLWRFPIIHGAKSAKKWAKLKQIGTIPVGLAFANKNYDACMIIFVMSGQVAEVGRAWFYVRLSEDI